MAGRQVVMYGLFYECKFLTIEETNKKKLFTQDVKIVCEIDIEVVFFYLLNENTIFYLMKTKQSCYYFNLFHESIYVRIYVGFTHVGLNVRAYTFLVSHEDSRHSQSV